MASETQSSPDEPEEGRSAVEEAPASSSKEGAAPDPPGATSSMEAAAVVSIAMLMLAVMTAGALLTRVVPLPPEDTSGSAPAAQTSTSETSASGFEADSAALAQMVESEQAVQAGAEIYEANCVSCHGAQGGGQVGPNLTDRYWIHGGTNQDIYRVVTEGVPEEGMMAWEQMLSAKERAQVTAFVRSLEGTNPPDAREPQGELIE